MVASVQAFYLVPGFGTDGIGTNQRASGMHPEAGPQILWGQGTPAAIAPFTSVNKGSLYLQVNASDDTSHVWQKVDEGGDTADWILFEAGSGSVGAADIALTNGTMLVGGGSGISAEQTISGDISISNAGLAAISSAVIVNADVAVAAGIVGSKLATNARRNHVVSVEFNIDNGGGTTIDDIVLMPSTAIVVVAAHVVYTEATDSAGVASANVRIGTTAGGSQLVAQTALQVSKAIGSKTALTVVSSDQIVAANGFINVRHTGVATTDPGKYKVVVEYTVTD